jgi:hypothetical protein
MWRIYKTGIGLTTGFIGSHTVTLNYSVYTLQFTVHYSTCRVFSLCLHWLPLFQHRRICSPSEPTATASLTELTGQLDSQLKTNCSHSAGARHNKFISVNNAADDDNDSIYRYFKDSYNNNYSLGWETYTEHHYRMLGTPDPYPGGTVFKSRRGELPLAQSLPQASPFPSGKYLDKTTE